MAAVDLGTEHKLSWPSSPESAELSVEVVRPDGMNAPATVDQVTGTATVLADMAGRWVVRWTSTNPADAHTDIFDVWPEDPRFLISLDDAVNGLNANRANREYMEDLRLYVAAATPVIEDITGPILADTRTRTVTGGRESVILPGQPSEVVAVEVNGEPVTAWWLQYGILFAGSRSIPSRFPGGELVVVYRVGNQVVPPNVRLAARELVRHWVQVGKQAVGGGIRNQDFNDDVFTPSGFAVPRRVIELCQPHAQVGGFA